MKRMVLAGILAFVLAACTASPPPVVPVEAAREVDFTTLEGHWWGYYSSVVSGRQGRIRFTLEAGEHEATGDVLMIPSRRPDAGSESADSAPQPPTTLFVRFVRVSDGTVAGALEPYRDPECGCQVSTTFLGRIRGDRIEGTYVSQGGRMHLGHSGGWEVERQAPDS